MPVPPVELTVTAHTAKGTCASCGKAATVTSLFLDTTVGHAWTPTLCHTCATAVGYKGVELTAPSKPGSTPPSRALRKRIRKEELETASLIGGRVQAASGAMPHAKGDVRIKNVLRLEEKSTGAASYSIKREILDKIRSECTGTERPAVLLRFRNPKTLATEDTWVLIPVEDWEHARHAAT